MDFTLHQLRVFTVITEKKSITRAAEALHMTQPAVSIQLKKLQDQFAIPLTEVIGRQLYITEFGQELYRIAEKILDDVGSISYRTGSFQGMLSGKLRIAVVSTGKYVMPYYLKHFLQANPGIDLVMDVNNKTNVIRSLENNEVDFSLVSILPEKIRVEQEILMPNKLFLTAAADAPLVFDKKTKKAMLGKLPLIYREEGSGTRHKMQDFFQKIHVQPQVKLELTSSEAVKQAVIAGLGYSVLSLLSIKAELLEKEIQIIPVPGLPLRTDWRLVWLKQKKFSAVAGAFLDFVRKNKKKIYEEQFKWIEGYE